MQAADLHCDTISKIYHARSRGEAACLRQNAYQVDIEKLRQGGYLLQNFAVFVDTGGQESPYACAKGQISLFYEEMERNRDVIRPVRTVDDIERNRKDGKESAVLTLEEGEICEGDLRKLEEFYEAGVRMMTLTWNYENSLATKEGLTELGAVFLERMEALGIVPDVSHLWEAPFYDVCRLAKKPFAASHSNAYALCPHPRNLSDDMIRQISERGGVVGVNFYGLFLDEDPREGVSVSRVSRIADHVLHMIAVGGISCVGLGSDFDGIDDRLELTDCSRISMLFDELKRRGLSEGELDSVFYKNALRLYRDAWKP